MGKETKQVPENVADALRYQRASISALRSAQDWGMDRQSFSALVDILKDGMDKTVRQLDPPSRNLYRQIISQQDLKGG